MKIKHLLAVALVCAWAFSTGNTNAQIPKEQRQKQGSNQSELNLSPKQSSKIKQIAQYMKNAAMQVKADPTLTDEQKVMKIDMIMRESKQAINSLLTPEQIASLAAKQRQ